MAPRPSLLVALAWLASRGAAAGGDDQNLSAEPDSQVLSAGFCCMFSPGHAAKPDHDGDVCSDCGVAETSSYCGASQDHCEGCGKAWCSRDTASQSVGGDEVGTTTKRRAAKKHRAASASGRARHPTSTTPRAQPEEQESTTSEGAAAGGEAASTTASAGNASEKSSITRRRGHGGKGHAKPKAAKAKTAPLRGMQVMTTRAKANGSALGTTTPGAKATSAAPVSPSASPTTTAAATSTSTSTATATLTSTVSTATTRTRRRFPFPSMMCWMVIVISGYEMDLIKPQCENRVSLWRCDEHIVFSDYTAELCNGEGTVPIGDMTSKISEWGSWSNTGNFVRAWGMVISDGHFRNHEWTVKVDADSVFYPERLRRTLEQHSSDKAVFLHNWKDSFGFLGPVEVLSTQAVEKLGEGNKTCQDEIGVEGSGEDGWLDSCLRLLGVDFEDAFEILDFSGSADACGNANTAVFHDFKSWDKYSDCMSRGPPMEDPPPVEAEDEAQEDSSDEDGGDAPAEDSSDGDGDAPAEDDAAAEGFCCSAAQDAGDVCGTCWDGAKVGGEDYCGKSRENCESCAQTWCGAGDGSQVLIQAFNSAGPRAAARRVGPVIAAASTALLAALLASAGLAACRSRRGRGAAAAAAAAGQERRALVAADGAATEV